MPPHHIWRQAALAWIALVAIPTAYAVIRWQMGLVRDPDMSGIGELIFTFVIILAAPMAALAFAVYAPLALAVDRIAKGRTRRVVNVMLGAMLAVPAVLVTMIVLGAPRHGLAHAVSQIAWPRPALGVFAALPAAGMIVGLGLRVTRRGSSSARGDMR